MRYQVAQTLKVKTPDGLMMIPPGKIVTITKPEKAARLVELGKVIPITRTDTDHPILEARHLFESTVDDLARTCPADLPSYLQEHHPTLWVDIMDIQEVVNDYWVELHEGQAVFLEFKSAVSIFKNKMLRGAELFRDGNHQGSRRENRLASETES